MVSPVFDAADRWRYANSCPLGIIAANCATPRRHRLQFSRRLFPLGTLFAVRTQHPNLVVCRK
jgi:hypothetical protein